MQDIELYRQLLGLNTPWTASRVELQAKEQRVAGWAGHAEGGRWWCPAGAAATARARAPGGGRDGGGAGAQLPDDGVRPGDGDGAVRGRRPQTDESGRLLHVADAGPAGADPGRGDGHVGALRAVGRNS